MSSRSPLTALLSAIALIVLIIGCGGGAGSSTSGSSATNTNGANSGTNTAGTNTAGTNGTDGSTSAGTTGTVGVLPPNVILFNQNDGSTRTIRQINPDGTGLTTVDTLPANYSGYTRSSADGKVAFGHDASGSQFGEYKIYVNSTLDVNGATLIDAGPYVAISYMQFTPDGSKLIYVAQDQLLASSLFVANANGTGTPVRLDAADDASLSPSGEVIVYSRATGGNGVIYRKRINNTGLVQVTHDAFDNFSPSWSKEGDKIYFSSSRDGTYSIWSMNPTGGAIAQVTLDGTLDVSPSANTGAGFIAFQRYSSNMALRGVYKVEEATHAVTPLHLDPSVITNVYWTGTNGRAVGSASVPWSVPSSRLKKLIDRLKLGSN